MKSGQQGYELIDFGDGRKLERFGSVTVDRPARGAWSPKAIPDAWESAELIYQGDRMNAGRGAWQSTSTTSRSLGELLSGWVCSVHGLTLQITPQNTGQLGVFPEHWNQWDWFAKKIAAKLPQGPVRVLNLFAYTGSTTLWMANQGATLTHVDAMKQAVDWGRNNAKLSGLEDRPIRWIVEDARKYVARELKRQSLYELIVLDPPSYGHGRKGEAWEIHRDLVALMKDCWSLMSNDPIGVVLTSHSLNISAKELRMELEINGTDQDRDKPKGVETEIFPCFLQDCSGRRLECGEGIRFSKKQE
ncbi:MAG: class I SAM-dependent methyltransferase [Planctomycetota bacterium]